MIFSILQIIGLFIAVMHTITIIARIIYKNRIDEYHIIGLTTGIVLIFFKYFL